MKMWVMKCQVIKFESLIVTKMLHNEYLPWGDLMLVNRMVRNLQENEMASW